MSDLLIRRKTGDTSARASERLWNGRRQKRRQNLRIVGVERNPDRGIGPATEIGSRIDLGTVSASGISLAHGGGGHVTEIASDLVEGTGHGTEMCDPRRETVTGLEADQGIERGTRRGTGIVRRMTRARKRGRRVMIAMMREMSGGAGAGETENGGAGPGRTGDARRQLVR